MKLAMSNIAWSPDERLEAYQILGKAGLAGLEIAPGLFFHAAEDPFEPDADVAHTAMAELTDAGLTLVSMQSLLFGVKGAGLFEGPDARAALVAQSNALSPAVWIPRTHSMKPLTCSALLGTLLKKKIQRSPLKPIQKSMGPTF